MLAVIATLPVQQNPLDSARDGPAERRWTRRMAAGIGVRFIMPEANQVRLWTASPVLQSRFGGVPRAEPVPGQHRSTMCRGAPAMTGCAKDKARVR
jgi:hypothetical protein